jgi:shikimate kinase
MVEWGWVHAAPTPKDHAVVKIGIFALFSVAYLRSFRFLMHLYLVGYRGSGKTTLAKHLSELLSLPWCDSDVEIERSEGCSIRQIFDKHGETGFRDREVAAIDRLSQRPISVIALGGGAVLRPKNRQTIARTGRCVWLTAAPEELAKRIYADVTTAERRPALTNLGHLEEIRSLLARREPLYREVANLIVETDCTPLEEIARRVADWYQQFGREEVSN